MIPIFLLLGLGHTCHADEAIIPYGTEPTMGPEMDTVYQAGTSGGPWSEEEVASTRQRVLQMIHPDWDVKEEMYQLDKSDSTKGEISENVLLRLVFHDCMRYTDGSGGCDGCLNWHGVGNQMPNPNDGDDMYNFEPFDETDNNGLDQITEKLELIYTTINWPFQTARKDCVSDDPEGRGYVTTQPEV